jgi:hypothetical protein
MNQNVLGNEIMVDARYHKNWARVTSFSRNTKKDKMGSDTFIMGMSLAASGCFMSEDRRWISTTFGLRGAYSKI